MSHTILPKNQRNLGGFDLKSPQLQQSPSGPFGKIQVASNSTEQHPQRFQTHMHSPAGMRQASMENISSRHNTRLQRIVRALKNIKSAFAKFRKKLIPNTEIRHLRNADINKPLPQLPQNRSLRPRPQNKPLPQLPQNRSLRPRRQKVKLLSKVAPTPQEKFLQKKNNEDILHKEINAISNNTQNILKLVKKTFQNDKSHIHLEPSKLTQKIAGTHQIIGQLNILKSTIYNKLNTIYSENKSNRDQLQNHSGPKLRKELKQYFEEINNIENKLHNNIDQMKKLEENYQTVEKFNNSNLRAHNHGQHAKSMHSIALNICRLDALLQERKIPGIKNRTPAIHQMLKINTGTIDYLDGHRDAHEVLSRFTNLQTTLISFINKANPNIQDDVRTCANSVIKDMNNMFQHTFSQKPFTFSREYNYYQARNGDKVIANAQSSGTKLYLQAFKNMIKEKSGIDPSNFPTSNLLEFRTKIEKISNVWINNIVPLIEDSDTSNYGKARSEITKTQSKDPSMTVFLNSQSAVCRELSIIGSLLFSEYGIDTQVQSGTLKNQGGHAWLEIMNPNNKNNILAVLDSNYTRKLHPSKNDYMEKMSHPIELLPQKIVKLNTAQSIKFTL